MNRVYQDLRKEVELTTPINHSRPLLVQEEDPLPWVIEAPEVVSRKLNRYDYTVACCITVKTLGIELHKFLARLYIHLSQENSRIVDYLPN
jgi:hypothetical protein